MHVLANAKGTNITHGMGTLKENNAFIASLNLRIRFVRTSIGNVRRGNDRKVFVLLMLYILWCRQSERGLAKKQQQIPLHRGGGVSVFECVCSPKTKHNLSCFDSGTFGQVKTLCKGGRSTVQ
jgi:hypothetical protein